MNSFSLYRLLPSVYSFMIKPVLFPSQTRLEVPILTEILGAVNTGVGWQSGGLLSDVAAASEKVLSHLRFLSLRKLLLLLLLLIDCPYWLFRLLLLLVSRWWWWQPVHRRVQWGRLNTRATVRPVNGVNELRCTIESLLFPGDRKRHGSLPRRVHYLTLHFEN